MIVEIIFFKFLPDFSPMTIVKKIKIVILEIKKPKIEKREIHRMPATAAINKFVLFFIKNKLPLSGFIRDFIKRIDDNANIQIKINLGYIISRGDERCWIWTQKIAITISIKIATIKSVFCFPLLDCIIFLFPPFLQEGRYKRP